jgi:hypothetical protein
MAAIWKKMNGFAGIHTLSDPADRKDKTLDNGREWRHDKDDIPAKPLPDNR